MVFFLFFKLLTFFRWKAGVITQVDFFGDTALWSAWINPTSVNTAHLHQEKKITYFVVPGKNELFKVQSFFIIVTRKQKRHQPILREYVPTTEKIYTILQFMAEIAICFVLIDIIFYA